MGIVSTDPQNFYNTNDDKPVNLSFVYCQNNRHIMREPQR